MCGQRAALLRAVQDAVTEAAAHIRREPYHSPVSEICKYASPMCCTLSFIPPQGSLLLGNLLQRARVTAKATPNERQGLMHYSKHV